LMNLVPCFFCNQAFEHKPVPLDTSQLSIQVVDDHAP
jgi:hypothetical protein